MYRCRMHLAQSHCGLGRVESKLLYVTPTAQVKISKLFAKEVIKKYAWENKRKKITRN